jgi:phage gp29-like protein
MASKPSFLSRLFFAKPEPARIKSSRPVKADIANSREARISGLGQPQYIASTLDVQRIQNALRSAERGDTWMLFTIFRDMVASYGHLQAQWAKRKAVITGNAEILIPADPDNEDDKIACQVIKQIISNCDNWRIGLTHLLDATLYPLAAAEKIWEEVGQAQSIRYKYPLRYRLKEIAPIDPTLLCFKLPYVPSFAENDPSKRYDPDKWENWLRFYSTTSNGMVQYSMQNIYEPNPEHHIIHRGNMLSPVIPPNFGGQMRGILFPWLLSTQGRDWFALLMQKYGMPIPVAKVNTQQKDTVANMQQALALCSQLGGIVIDSKTAIEWGQVSSTDSANAHKTFQEWLDSHVSRIVGCESYSSNPKNTGMGSGAAAQSEEIREDLRKIDTMNLSDTLERQLFRQALEINGYRGNAPKIVWGGLRAGEASTLADTLATMASGGYELDEMGLKTTNQQFGFTFRRKPEADVAEATPGRQVNRQKNSNPSKVKY